MQFTHVTLGQRVRFGTGRAADDVALALREIGAERVLLVASRRQDDVAASVARVAPVTVRWDEVVRHVPRGLARRAVEVAATHEVDALVSVGGGSATGLAKAVALETGLPVVAVPTTYSGSEATDVWGTTEDGRKVTGTDPRVLPHTVVYDAALTRDLPLDLTVASGLNALAHAVDALWGPRADPIDAVHAQEAARALASSIGALVADPRDAAAREEALYGCYLSAVAFASAGSGLHHKLCHVLGGMFDLPHAQTHATVLPHVVALNAPAAPLAARRLATALGAPSAEAGLAELYRRLGVAGSLRALGMPYDGIGPAADAALTVAPPSNPAPLDRERLVSLLTAAWEGHPA